MVCGAPSVYDPVTKSCACPLDSVNIDRGLDGVALT